ncbi:MAG: hypothetical protein NVSMB66_0280 [Candidatus Doudnabacteria bacterium]
MTATEVLGIPESGKDLSRKESHDSLAYGKYREARKIHVKIGFAVVAKEPDVEHIAQLVESISKLFPLYEDSFYGRKAWRRTRDLIRDLPRPLRLKTVLRRSGLGPMDPQ